MTRRMSAVCLAGAMLVAGCDSGQSFFGSTPSNTATGSAEVRTSRNAGRLRVWTDPETGCQYLLRGRSSRGSITPRLKPDGLPLCKPVTPTAER